MRTYARHLRKRLAEYYSAEGLEDPLQIELPKGGYVVAFVTKPLAPLPVEGPREQPSLFLLEPPVATEGRRLWWGIGLLLYSAALLLAGWLLNAYLHQQHSSPDPSSKLWASLFNDGTQTYIVPADAGLNILEDVSQQTVSWIDYVGGGYHAMPLPGVDTHSAQDMRTQEFTSFVDLRIVAELERRPEFTPKRVTLCFPRELHLENLKYANVVILGSEGSNPWANLAERAANFKIVSRPGMLINAHPQPGEAASYVSHWDQPAHETFALLSYLPNLEGTGHLLLLQGLDVAGTEAAADALFHPAAIAPFLRRRRAAMVRCGRLRFCFAPAA